MTMLRYKFVFTTWPASLRPTDIVIYWVPDDTNKVVNAVKRKGLSMKFGDSVRKRAWLDVTLSQYMWNRLAAQSDLVKLWMVECGGWQAVQWYVLIKRRDVRSGEIVFSPEKACTCTSIILFSFHVLKLCMKYNRHINLSSLNFRSTI